MLLLPAPSAAMTCTSERPSATASGPVFVFQGRAEIGVHVMPSVEYSKLALATLTVIPVVSVATAWFRKRSGRAYRAVRETIGAVTATLAEDIAGMRVLQSFTREAAAKENFRQVSDTYRISNMQTVVLSGIYFPVLDFLSSASTAVVLGYGGWLVWHGDTSIGTLVHRDGWVQDRLIGLKNWWNRRLG